MYLNALIEAQKATNQIALTTNRIKIKNLNQKFGF